MRSGRLPSGNRTQVRDRREPRNRLNSAVKSIRSVNDLLLPLRNVKESL